LVVLYLAFRFRKKGADGRRNFRLVVAFAVVGFVGLLMSLGPLLKLGDGFTYGDADGYKLVLPLPYLLVDLLLPQLSFIRSIGRATVLVLFALCAAITFLPLYAENLKLTRHKRYIAAGALCILLALELFPLHRTLMSPNAYSYNMRVPAVYKYVVQHREVNDIIIIRADKDYPGAPFAVARAEDVLWAGYHNRNIFNGYSGYEPPDYQSMYKDFVDFGPDDLPKLQALHLRYVLVDKQLCASNPGLIDAVRQIVPHKVYEDKRYALFALESPQSDHP
jgi:hypothetical protein